MISKREIEAVVSRYDVKKLTVATICSHSALQIFHGARLEGLRTLGICTRKQKPLYEAFPLARPDEFIALEGWKDVIKPEVQAKLVESNAVVIPHGSFVEYVGAKEIMEEFAVPMFGNRMSLLWEADRQRQREWLESAGLKLPKEYRQPEDVDGRVFVKLHGAKGGRGFFTASSGEEVKTKLIERVKRGIVAEHEAKRFTIQEFLSGVRYYPHYFSSVFGRLGAPVRDRSVELLSMDKRVEPIDESYRGLPTVPEDFFDYTVTGNLPIVARESMLPEILDMGVRVVSKSIDLFPDGLVGPFSLETIYHPERGFTVFEISARIVAGTNLYPTGSPYSAYIFPEPMSTGRRIARELRLGLERGELERVTY
jgi:5-formaminoimidazole-4-carboxamide-1-(beta)-D-ribofuranosyl 5'-monophosphate synthetase